MIRRTAMLAAAIAVLGWGASAGADGAPPPPHDIDAGAGGTLVADSSGRSCNQGATADAKSRVDLEASQKDFGLGFDSRSSSLQVRVSVVNGGTAASRAFVTGVYLYPASDRCRAYPVGTIPTRALAAHGTRMLTGVFDLGPASKRPPAGTYRVGVVLDVTGSVAEGDETNNVVLLPETIRFE